MCNSKAFDPGVTLPYSDFGQPIIEIVGNLVHLCLKLLNYDAALVSTDKPEICNFTCL